MNPDPASQLSGLPCDCSVELARVVAENTMLRDQLSRVVGLKQASLELAYRLDQVLTRFGAMQRFIQRSVAAETVEEFAPIACESIIDLLDCSVAIFWSLDPALSLKQRFYQSGLFDIPDEYLRDLDIWVKTWMDSKAAGEGAEVGINPLPEEFRVVNPFLVECIRDSAGRPLAVIMAGNTAHQAGFKLEVNDSDETVFTTFAKQVGGMIVSIERNQLIKLQIQTIRTSEERLNAALASSNVGLWDWDTSCDRVYYSDQWKFQLGYSVDEIGDTTAEWITRLHPDDRDEALKVSSICAVTPNGSFNLTLRMRAKNRRWLWINTRGYNLTKADGTERRMIGTHIDVTAFKSMEARLIRAERRQRVARVQAERENLAKSSFLASVSHEIRTPLNGILGVFQMLRMPGDMEQAQFLKLVEMGQASGMWMLKIIGESLDIARIEAGKVMELKPEVLDLHALLEEFRSITLKRTADLELEFHFCIAPDVPRWVRVDAGRLRQILVNLLDNALKFTREGFVSLNIRGGDSDKDGERDVHFEFIDSGIGISKSFGRKIFKPFTQATNKSQSSDHGIGLGLMITKELVKLMGGEIEFASKRGQGSRFKVVIPLEHLPQRGSLEKDCGRASIMKFEGVVLIIDDDDICIEVARLMLNRLGLEVDLAKNGVLGLELAKSRRYDMILMDCWMPGMSGIQTTVELRSSSKALSKDAPVIALTANAGTTDAEACRVAGMNEFITKPLLIESLIEILSRYLS